MYATSPLMSSVIRDPYSGICSPFESCARIDSESAENRNTCFRDCEHFDKLFAFTPHRVFIALNIKVQNASNCCNFELFGRDGSVTPVTVAC